MSRHLNRRQRTLLLVFCSVIALLTVTVAGGLLSGQAMVTDFSRKNLAPCMAYPFGTDWMGRDKENTCSTSVDPPKISPIAPNCKVIAGSRTSRAAVFWFRAPHPSGLP